MIRDESNHGPESGAESFWRRTGSGWERIWRARTNRAQWGEAAALLDVAWRPLRWPETARRPRRLRILERRVRLRD